MPRRFPRTRHPGRPGLARVSRSGHPGRPGRPGVRAQANLGRWWSPRVPKLEPKWQRTPK
eukprot:14395719-Heterocapsa_arctica.AAC.1